MKPDKTNHLEVEVKFYLKEPFLIRQRLLAMGTICQERTFETNQRYDDSEQRLFRLDRLLRLRNDSACRLTFKRKPAAQDPGYKVYHELEVRIDDCETMALMLNELGFRAVQVYEKWRETVAVDDTLVCLDTMPFGDFIEIEGSKAGIRSVAEKLGLAWRERILHNYLAIFSVLREKEQLPFNDLTFVNFERNPVDISRHLTLFHAVDV